MSKHNDRLLLLLTILLLLAFGPVACNGAVEEVSPTTAAPTEAPTEEPTEVPTEVPTEAPTEAPTEVPTEAPTETPVEETVSTNAVTVEDQTLNEDNTVTIASVTSDDPGWLVIHADADGAPGPVIGHTAVQAGENENVAVEIDSELATETLYAMLHVDAGAAGEYEFPGDDVPARDADGNVVTPAFQLSESSAGTGLDELSEGDAENGESLFKATYGCIACHGDPAEPGSNLVGPHLGNIANAGAERIEGKTAAEYIYESITDPSAFIAPICANDQACPDPTVMPLDFSERMSQQDLADIIAFLLEQTGEQ